MQKMTRKDLTDMFPPLIPDEVDKDIASGATRPNHKHKHQPSRKPSAGRIIPAKYRRKHAGRKR